MKWREALTARLVDVTLPRAQGSLAVAQSHVVAVYGFDLVEAASAIYVIEAGSVARVDTVIARASVHLVGAFAGDDLVVATTAFDRVVAAASVELVVPGATREVVLSFGPEESIVAGGAEEVLRQGFMRAEQGGCDHNYHHRQQDVYTIHLIPPLIASIWS